MGSTPNCTCEFCQVNNWKMAVINVRARAVQQKSKPLQQTKLDLFTGCIAPQRFSLLYSPPKGDYENFANVFCLSVKKTTNIDEFAGR